MLCVFRYIGVTDASHFSAPGLSYSGWLGASHICHHASRPGMGRVDSGFWGSECMTTFYAALMQALNEPVEV